MSVWAHRHRPAPHVQLLDRWRAHRTSRRFADVGVHIAPGRLREITAGAPLAGNESVDVNFALAATGIRREQRLARARRTRQRAVQWLIVAGLVVAALNALVCIGYVFISLALHAQPL